MNFIGLLSTLILGLSILFGVFIIRFIKNKDRFLLISLSMAFGVMVSLIILELLPEVYEIFMGIFDSYIAIVFMIVIATMGFFILKLLDIFIPDHEDADEDNLMHIGIVSSIAITLHNIIEGMAVYSTIGSSSSVGLLLCLGVALHNIPLGMALSSSFYNSMKNKKKSNLIIILISLSTFIGGLTMSLFNNIFDNEMIIGIFLLVTIGMLVYINIFEILPRMIKEKNKKAVIISTAVGVLILVISVLLG